MCDSLCGLTGVNFNKCPKHRTRGHVSRVSGCAADNQSLYFCSPTSVAQYQMFDGRVWGPFCGFIEFIELHIVLESCIIYSLQLP